MGGIFGVIGKRSPEISRALNLGIQALAHRGPDNEGMEIVNINSKPDWGVGLGFRRLAILDLSPADPQPMHDPARGLSVIFNGEIYNYKEIRIELIQKGHSFRSTGDSEVLLIAYCEWGDSCGDRLRGFCNAKPGGQSRRRVVRGGIWQSLCGGSTGRKAGGGQHRRRGGGSRTA